MFTEEEVMKVCVASYTKGVMNREELKDASRFRIEVKCPKEWIKDMMEHFIIKRQEDGSKENN